AGRVVVFDLPWIGDPGHRARLQPLWRRVARSRRPAAAALAMSTVLAPRPILEVRGLKLSIRTDEGIARVLDHIDFALEPGHILGIVGESGCGKSTVIRAILGILPHGVRIEAGAIRFAGEDLLALGESELNRRIRGSRIGFVPQDPYLALNPVFKIGT